MNRKNPRTAATWVLTQVLAKGQSLANVLPRALENVGPKDRALAQELCYGTLRWLPRLETVLEQGLERPLKAKDCDIRALLLLGLYQLAYTGIAPHAAVSETVSVVGALKKGWAKGLVNAVLRRFQRESASMLAAADRQEPARYAHPQWLLDMFKDDWPGQWQSIVANNNERPPMTLRVNSRKVTRDQYLAKLAAAGIEAQATLHSAVGIVLKAPVPVERLPEFAEGEVSVQDEAAQLAAPLLDAQAGQLVLDACAAPGGKTAHILEAAPEVEVIALDKDLPRLDRVHENLQRLGLEARVLQGDAGQPSSWWDGRPFDRILLDAPCSATGVIRRHPDIKTLRHPTDIHALAEEQGRILNALWPLLKPGGILVYATCSVLTLENTQQVLDFLAKQSDAGEMPLDVDWGVATRVGRQILPGRDMMDGFYYARLAKVAK